MPFVALRMRGDSGEVASRSGFIFFCCTQLYGPASQGGLDGRKTVMWSTIKKGVACDQDAGTRTMDIGRWGASLNSSSTDVD